MTTFNYGRTRTEGDYGNSPQAAALRRQLADLAALERTATYQEMCAAADRSVAAGGHTVQTCGDYNTSRALAASPPPRPRSAGAGRGGDAGGAREPLASGKSSVAPGRSLSEAGA